MTVIQQQTLRSLCEGDVHSESWGSQHRLPKMNQGKQDQVPSGKRATRLEAAGTHWVKLKQLGLHINLKIIFYKEVI